MRTSSLITALAAAGALAAVPAGLLAHSALTGSTPEAGANLDDPPGEVIIAFAGELQPDGSGFTVTDADGADVGSGDLDLEVADRNELRGTVSITEPGVYTVSWSSVAADGHRESGDFSFGFRAEVPPPATEGGHGDNEGPDTAVPAPGPPLGTASGTVLLAAALCLAFRRLALR
ncbi:MAG: copper resistance CopC family protein [Candidatus Limnocylindria bacterium]